MKLNLLKVSIAKSMKVYNEEDFLMLSGIQHFEFCRRQWALIHVEQEWQDNVLTLEGHLIHERADNVMTREKRGDLLIIRALPLHSFQLGISGICDVVECMQHPDGVPITGEQGTYILKPVEYKRGKSKAHDADRLQLTAQVMCLEEMFLHPPISSAYLYYQETRRREEVIITDELRNRVCEITDEMHKYFQQRHTPRVKTGRHCQSCSLRHICLPELLNREKASAYIERMLRA